MHAVISVTAEKYVKTPRELRLQKRSSTRVVFVLYNIISLRASPTIDPPQSVVLSFAKSATRLSMCGPLEIVCVREGGGKCLFCVSSNRLERSVEYDVSITIRCFVFKICFDCLEKKTQVPTL